jgi:hypothetical protein
VKVPNTHTAIISEKLYKTVRANMKARTREVIHPRTLASKYLLSAILRCKKCGSAMTACSAKSGKFHYYFCQTNLKKGKEHCDQKMIPVKKIEPLIINTIKSKILTKDNIKKLLLMINDELKKFDVEYKTKLELIDEVLTDKLKRRSKIYEGIETDTVNLQDVAPRLKQLNIDIEELEEQKQEILEKHQNGDGLNIDDEQLKPYVENLKETLSQGEIPARKSFIRSFVKKITVDYPKLDLEYTFPLPTKEKDRTSTTEVLSLKQYGVAG